MIHWFEPRAARRCTGIGLARCVARILLVSACGAGSIAAAQDNSPRASSADQSSGLQEVIVTGSRIARSSFDAPNPVTVLGSDEMQKLGIANVGDVLAQLPQNSAFVTAANVGLGNFNIGAQLANLRGLNPFYGTRTLTLIDGRRFVPSTNGGAVDLNLIPSNLVSRIETVTGGASAAYGTDAIAGVVNVILDTKLNGFKGQIDGGETIHNDGATEHAAAAWGTDIAAGRGHFIIGGEFEHDGGIGDCASSRDWCKQAWDVFNTGGPPGLPGRVIGPNGRSGNETITGVFPFLNPGAPALANTQFNASGTAVVPFNKGNYNNSPVNLLFASPVQGGDSNINPYDVVTIRPPVTHYEGLAHLNYNLTDSVQAFIELSYGRRYSNNEQFSLGPTLATIFRDNPYLPPAVAAQITGASAFFNASVLDYVRQANHTNNNTYRAVTGLRGDISARWHWDAYYQYGQNKQAQALNNLVVSGTAGKYTFLRWALDAVRDPATGSIVCRATLPGPAYNPLAAGCVPLDLFGSNKANPAAIAYVYRTLPENFIYQQHVVAANIHGDLFEGFGAGPVGVAVGIEYRHDGGNVTHDMARTPWYRDFGLSYGLDFKGTIKVVEGYGEINLPLLKGLPGANNLELDGAVRQTHNSSADELTGQSKGLNITTWKLSAIYDPVDWFRLRGTRSKDIRAAGFRELFYKAALTMGGAFGSVNNPWLGGTSQATSVQGGGSFNLQPEEATTTTLGIVFRPQRFASGFVFSADWYDIRIGNAITTPSANTLANNCYQFRTFCDRINHGVLPVAPGYAITYIDTTALNLNQFVSRGIDFEADYRLPLGGWGDLSFRAIASWLYNFTVAGVNWAGQSGPTAAFGDFNTSPKWQGNTFVTWAKGPFTGTVQLRVIGAGTFNATYVGPDDPRYNSILANPGNYRGVITVNNNHVPSAAYVNLSASYQIIDRGSTGVELFGAIDNLLDRDPPVAPGGNGYPTNPVYFDTYGMIWKAGVRVRF